MQKTNAMRMLDKAKIHYDVHEYDTSDGQIDGVSVANKCHQPIDHVYKTLVTTHDHDYFVFVIPVDQELDLKKCAKAVSVKSVEMVHVKDLLKITGYIRGGCSPIGMKKQFQTFFASDISKIDWLYVSGGKIGLQIQIGSQDLIHITNGKIVDIVVD